MSKAWVFLPVRSKGKNVEKAKIDKEDEKRCLDHTWRVVTKDTGRKKVVTNIIDNKGRNRQISLGNFLMKPPKGKMVYPRRFMEGFDYRKNNLIVCTMAERQRILPKSRVGGSSKYKGVSYIQSQKRWRASITFEGRSISIGNYRNQDEAALNYNKAAIHYFGKDAYQNQIIPKKKRGGDRD